MPRQRLRTSISPFGFVRRILVFLVACALVFYGAVVAGLALGADPELLDAISGYRSAYDYLADLEATDISDLLRVIAGVAGLVAFALFAYLAWKAVPRPYLARQDLELSAEPRGTVTVEPRAVERVAEAAVLEHPGVADAAGRYGDEEIAVGVTVRRARDVAQILEDAQGRVIAALERHGLPRTSVNLTLTGFERRTRRELD